MKQLWIPAALSFTAVVVSFLRLGELTVSSSEPSQSLRRTTPNAPQTAFKLPLQEEIVRSRVYDKWPQNLSIPCLHPRSRDNNGFMFLKLLKTGSSTGSGIQIRIARNVATRQKKDFQMCKASYKHRKARGFGSRVRADSYLWTLVRDPNSRYLSQFFHFEASRSNVPPTDDNINDFLRNRGGKASNQHYLTWLSVHQYNPVQVQDEKEPFQEANRILSHYDFIGITERLNESLVVLMMLLGLQMADILYMSTKSSGGYDDGGYKNRCIKIQKSFRSPGVRAYLESKEWQDYIAPELELFRAANQSLDRTIEALGPEFAVHLRKFEEAQLVVDQECTPTVAFPCTDKGVKRRLNETDCVWDDSGCGFDCLDQVATKLGLWE